MSIEVRREDDLAWLRLSRPGRGNALDEADMTALRRCLVSLGDAPPRVLVLEAEGDDFCLGLDLEPDNAMFEVLSPLAKRGDRYGLQERLVGYRAALDTLGRLASVTVTAIRGRCVGLGLELALATDLRFVAENSTFSLPGATGGLQAWGGGLVRLTRLVGRGRTTDLAVTGRVLDARTAEAWGLVTRVVGDPDEAAGALARALVAQPTVTIQQTILAIRAAEDLSDRAFGFEAEAAARSLCRELDAGLEAWRAAKTWKQLG